MFEYVREKKERRMKVLVYERRKCKDRNKWRFFCCGLEEFIGINIR